MTDRLDVLAKEINAAFRREESARLQAGQRLLEAQGIFIRRRAETIMEGICGLSNWKDWCASHIQRSWSDIKKCMALARADDPAKAIEAERAAARDSMARSRAKAQTFEPPAGAVGIADPMPRVMEIRAAPATTAEENVNQTAEDEIWDQLRAGAEAAGDKYGPWQWGVGHELNNYTYTVEAAYRALWDSVFDPESFPGIKRAALAFDKRWADNWFIGDLATFEIDERVEALAALNGLSDPIPPVSEPVAQEAEPSPSQRDASALRASPAEAGTEEPKWGPSEADFALGVCLMMIESYKANQIEPTTIDVVAPISGWIRLWNPERHVYEVYGPVLDPSVLASIGQAVLDENGDGSKPEFGELPGNVEALRKLRDLLDADIQRHEQAEKEKAGTP
jgi:hypothetical protein